MLQSIPRLPAAVKTAKALLAMGIPTMISMLVNAFYNLVDAYFVGGFGKSQMVAISQVVSTCVYLTYILRKKTYSILRLICFHITPLCK